MKSKTKSKKSKINLNTTNFYENCFQIDLESFEYELNAQNNKNKSNKDSSNYELRIKIENLESNIKDSFKDNIINKVLVEKTSENLKRKRNRFNQSNIYSAVNLYEIKNNKNETNVKNEKKKENTITYINYDIEKKQRNIKLELNEKKNSETTKKQSIKNKNKYKVKDSLFADSDKIEENITKSKQHQIEFNNNCK